MAKSKKALERVADELVPPGDPIEILPGLTIRPLLGAEIDECYYNAFSFACHNRDWTLVHGIPTGTGESIKGLQYGHAWCEMEVDGIPFVYDPSYSELIPAPVYYATGRIEYTVRYSIMDAVEQMLIHETFGQWDPVIAAAMHTRRDAS